MPEWPSGCNDECIRGTTKALLVQWYFTSTTCLTQNKRVCIFATAEICSSLSLRRQRRYRGEWRQILRAVGRAGPGPGIGDLQRRMRNASTSFAFASATSLLVADDDHFRLRPARGVPALSHYTRITGTSVVPQSRRHHRYIDHSMLISSITHSRWSWWWIITDDPHDFAGGVPHRINNTQYCLKWFQHKCRSSQE